VEQVLGIIQGHSEEASFLLDFLDKELDLQEILSQEDQIKEGEVLVANDGTIMALPFQCALQEGERA
jgi:hypothetical protein